MYSLPGTDQKFEFRCHNLGVKSSRPKLAARCSSLFPSLSRVEMTSLRSVYSDAGSEGPAVVYGLDRELAEKAKYKYDPQMELEAREWIEAVLREPLGSGTLHEVLKDGVVLCLLINTIKPAVCAKPSASRMPFKQMENIANYLQACTQLSVPSHDLFQTVALFENKDMIAVLTNIHSLGRVSQKIPGFVGPSLGEWFFCRVGGERVSPPLHPL